MILRLIVFLLLATSSNVLCQSSFVVRRGKLNLTQWDSAKHPVILLDGEWEFYWNKLVLYNELKENDISYAQLSIPWNEQIIGGHEYPKNGCATYALEILLPPKMKSVGFAVPAVFNSYSFWVNDKLICHGGRVGRTQHEMIPQWRPQTIQVNTPSDTLHIAFQISNFQQTRGGCAEIMRIGNTQYLMGLNAAFHTSGMIVIIIFGIVAVGGLSLAFINRRNSFLFIALLALAYILRFLFSDLYFYYDLGINPGWELAAKIEYLTIPLIILCAALFISTIYPQEFKRNIFNIFIIVNAALILVVVLADSSIFSPLLVALQVAGLVFAVFIIYIIIRAILYKRSGAWISGMGVAIFALVGFYNIYAFVIGIDLNRIFIHSGYTLALVLNVVSLIYRTPLRLEAEEQDILRYTDLYSSDDGI